MNGERHSLLALETVRAVLAAFFGVRSRRRSETIRLNPVLLIAAGIAGAGVLVATLVLLVKFIVNQAA